MRYHLLILQLTRDFRTIPLPQRSLALGRLFAGDLDRLYGDLRGGKWRAAPIGGAPPLPLPRFQKALRPFPHMPVGESALPMGVTHAVSVGQQQQTLHPLDQRLRRFVGPHPLFHLFPLARPQYHLDGRMSPLHRLFALRFLRSFTSLAFFPPFLAETGT